MKEQAAGRQDVLTAVSNSENTAEDITSAPDETKNITADNDHVTTSDSEASETIKPSDTTDTSAEPMESEDTVAERNADIPVIEDDCLTSDSDGQTSSSSEPASKEPVTETKRQNDVIYKQDGSDSQAIEQKAPWKGVLKWIGNMAMISVKLILLAAIAVTTWRILTPYFRVDRNKSGDSMRNLPENSIDVLALGSSHIQYAFNPAIFSAETGCYSLVFGSVCQPFAESYYLLQEVLKTQHPEVVIVDVFTLLPQSQVCYADGTYYIAMDMMEGNNRIEAANGIPDTVNEDTKLGYTYDLYMNHGNWKDMDLSDMESIIRNGQPSDSLPWDLGYVAQEPELFRYTPLEVLEPQYVAPLSDREKMWIDKMMDLCEEEDIHLIFVKTPYIENQDDANKLAGIWQYLDSKHAEYIDFLQKAADLEWFLDMDGDTWHNNTWGAEIITKELARVISEKNYVTKHHDSTEMQMIYDTAIDKAAQYLMNENNINIYRLLEEAGKYPCTILLNYQGKSRTSIQEYENEALQKLGFTHDFIKDRNKSYCAIVKNGKLIEENSKPFETTADGKMITFAKEGIQIDGTVIGEPGDLQIIFCGNDFEWLNPISIDTSTSAFWKKGCQGWDCTVNP